MQRSGSSLCSIHPALELTKGLVACRSACSDDRGFAPEPAATLLARVCAKPAVHVALSLPRVSLLTGALGCVMHCIACQERCCALRLSLLFSPSIGSTVNQQHQGPKPSKHQHMHWCPAIYHLLHARPAGTPCVGCKLPSSAPPCSASCYPKSFHHVQPRPWLAALTWLKAFAYARHKTSVGVSCFGLPPGHPARPGPLA